MTGGETMRCSEARDLLVELVCGELPEARGAEVRAHAESCPSCGPELEKMSQVMDVAMAIPLSEPSPRVEARVMLAAREALSARGGSTPAREFAYARSQPKTWLGRLARWAMSPQVAMASVLMLMVGIGLYALPIGREPERVAFEAADHAEQAEPVASATAAPTPEPEPLADAQEEKSAPSREAPELGVRRGRRAEKGSSGAPQAKPAAVEPEARVAKKGAASSVTAKSEGAPKASSSRSAGGGALADESFAPPPPAAARAFPEAPAGAPSGQNVGAARDDDGDGWASQALADGKAAAQRGAYAQAITLLLPVAQRGPANLRSQANLWLARSYRGQGECGRALTYYAPLVQRASASSDVLMEAADCYEKQGDSARAGELRKRAAGE